MLVILIVLTSCVGYTEAKTSVVGCVSNEQAQSIFEKISKLFNNVALYDTIDGLFKNNVSDSSIEAITHCDGGFQDRYDEKVKLTVGLALQAENEVKEANDNRIKQVEVGRIFEDTWKKIQKLFRTHEKTVYSLDIFFKDSLMQKAANISFDIRSGNKGDQGKAKWTLKKIWDKLNVETGVTGAIMTSMPAPMYKVLKTALKQILLTNLASQFYSAIHETDLMPGYRLNAQKLNSISKRFSELSISKDIRRSAKLKYDTMVVGVEEAEEYAEKTTETLELVRAVVEKINTANDYNSCSKNKQIGTQAINEVEEIANSLKENEVKFAGEYLSKINDYYRNTFKPYMSIVELDSAMNVIKDTLPEERNTLLEDTHSFLRQFFMYASNNGVGSLYPHWFMFLNATVEKMDVMVNYAQCHFKIVKILGDIIQDCNDGKGTFDQIHERITSRTTIDNQECLAASMIQVPTKEELKQALQDASEKLTFSADCQSNTPPDDVPHRYYDNSDDDDDDDDESVNGHLSPSQRFTVCNLRSKSISNNDIAEKISMALKLVENVRCIDAQSRDMVHDGKITKSTLFNDYMKPFSIE